MKRGNRLKKVVHFVDTGTIDDIDRRRSCQQTFYFIFVSLSSTFLSVSLYLFLSYSLFFSFFHSFINFFLYFLKSHIILKEGEREVQLLLHTLSPSLSLQYINHKCTSTIDVSFDRSSIVPLIAKNLQVFRRTFNVERLMVNLLLRHQHVLTRVISMYAIFMKMHSNNIVAIRHNV